MPKLLALLCLACLCAAAWLLSSTAIAAPLVLTQDTPEDAWVPVLAARPAISTDALLAASNWPLNR